MAAFLTSSSPSLLQGYYWSNPLGGVEPLFLRARYYGGWIHHLKLSSHAFNQRIIEPLSALCGSQSLFPVLRSLLWVIEGQPPSTSSISTFVTAALAPQVARLAINVSFQPRDFEDKLLLANGMLQALSQAADNTAITSFSIVGPLSFALPAFALRGFSALKSAKIQVNLLRMLLYTCLSLPTLICFISADMHGAVWPEALGTLFLRWTLHMDFFSVARTMRLHDLHTLTIAAAGDLSSSLLQQISSCSGAVQFPSLKRLVLFAGMDYPIALTAVDFSMLIHPFLPSSSMHHVYIQLPSFELSFTCEDFDCMLDSWPLLRSLRISFATSHTSTPMSPPSEHFPDLRHVVENTYLRCHYLQTLHIPVIAVYSRPDTPFILKPTALHQHFRFSSDTLFLEHLPYDVSFQIHQAFPRYMAVRRHYIIGTFWSVVEPLVKLMFRSKVLATLEVYDWTMGFDE